MLEYLNPFFMNEFFFISRKYIRSVQRHYRITAGIASNTEKTQKHIAESKRKWQPYGHFELFQLVTLSNPFSPHSQKSKNTKDYNSETQTELKSKTPTLPHSSKPTTKSQSQTHQSPPNWVSIDPNNGSKYQIWEHPFPSTKNQSTHPHNHTQRPTLNPISNTIKDLEMEKINK